MKNKETLEEAAERLYPISPQKRKIWINGAKWQQEQEQNNENSWFNEYQEVENYIIKRIGNKFLEATPDKYKTASEATIALLENNWKKENMYSEDDMIMFADFFHNYKELLKKEKWEILEMSKEDVFKKWKQI